MLDIEIVFGREGRSGARIITLSALGQSRSRANGMDCDAASSVPSASSAVDRLNGIFSERPANTKQPLYTRPADEL
jgi:hypothetical protein